MIDFDELQQRIESLERRLFKLEEIVRNRSPYLGKVIYPALSSAYSSGKSLQEVAETFGCSKETVKRACKLNGIKMRPAGTPKKSEFVAFVSSLPDFTKKEP